MTSLAWLCSAVTIVSALVGLGFSTAGLRTATAAARVPSEYAWARSASLAVLAVIAPFTGDPRFIAAAATAMIGVQALDCLVGVRIGDPARAWGPLAIAAINAAALVWFLVAG